MPSRIVLSARGLARPPLSLHFSPSAHLCINHFLCLGTPLHLRSPPSSSRRRPVCSLSDGKCPFPPCCIVCSFRSGWLTAAVYLLSIALWERPDRCPLPSGSAWTSTSTSCGGSTGTSASRRLDLSPLERWDLVFPPRDCRDLGLGWRARISVGASIPGPPAAGASGPWPPAAGGPGPGPSAAGRTGLSSAHRGSARTLASRRGSTRTSASCRLST